MSLASGTRLGPYEILGPLGAGGMGEVYRARDTKLDRDVAIKVLPRHLAADPDALERFEREAKAIAALSHPNILAIHDFGRVDGTAFAVTELLEGETLRDRLSAGALPQKKALQFARDIARGLAAAHDKRIVHRDLKPENVFVAADGQVKILDFGLAKTVEPVARPDEATDTSISLAAGDAQTELRTDPGTVMGTVGYMSPEQVKGQPADPRSDIFSLGCVLFEMVAGRRPFQRETVAETMTAILREDPPDLASDGGTTSPAVEELIRHCLEKRPDERFQSARDLAFALQGLSGSQTTSGRSLVAPERAAPAPTRRLRPLLVPAVVAVAAFFAGRFFTAPEDTGSAALVSFEQLTDSPGVETTPALSPDGRSIVYAAESGGSSDLYLLRVGGRSPVLLTPNAPDRDLTPAFSPDGERLAFRSERDGGGIFLMSATGESVTRLSDFGFNPSWSPDGREVAVSPGSFTFATDRGSSVPGLIAIDVATGARREISKIVDAMQPSWSPHGQRIAFWGLRGNSGQRDLFTIAADGSEGDVGGHTVTDDAALDWNPVWAPDGRALYFSSNRGGTMNLWRIALDESTGDVLGEPEPLTTPSLWSGGFSFSRDGTKMAYASLDWRSTLYRVAFDPVREVLAGTPQPLRRSTRPIRDHELSPDGQWVAFMETGAQEDLFVARTDGTEYRKLTDDVFRDRGPVWSPDGSRLAFYSDRTGAYQLWTIRPDGSGITQVIESEFKVNFPTWSPDGSELVSSSVGAPDWFEVRMPDGEAATLMVRPGPGGGRQFWPMSWAHGDRIAGLRYEADGADISVMIYDRASGEYTSVPGATSGSFVLGLWLDDERLVLRDPGGIWVLHLDGRRTRLLDVGGYIVGRSLGVARDGRWITYTETGTEGDIWLATIR